MRQFDFGFTVKFGTSSDRAAREARTEKAMKWGVAIMAIVGLIGWVAR